MRHRIPRANWHMKLADAIDDAEPGDAIVCHNADMKALGERARIRMCPGKPLTFELENDQSPKETE